MPPWLENIRESAEAFAPILILLVVVGLAIARLPKVEAVDHSKAYRRRRVMNWLPLGLTYAFLYMGRYNIKVSQHAFGDMKNVAGEPMMSNADFSTIFFVGVVVYGVSFVLNGPLTDRFGGKLAILIGAGGSLMMNAVMALLTWSLVEQWSMAETVSANFVPLFSVVYGANMYFQSFGAVAVVKVNAPWFHVRERGVFGAIFGILISLGVYFAYDWGKLIIDHLPLQWVFGIPTIILAILWVFDFFMVQNTPGQAGHTDFDLGDATEDGPSKSVVQVFAMMLKNPIILTIAGIEFCSGFLRQAIMQWYRTFAKQTDVVLGLKDSFVYENWGLLLCCAGIMGGVFAGVISDHLFQSRRGPVAGILYAGMLIGAAALTAFYTSPAVGLMVVAMSMCVIGVHGMLSGTASMDFGGKKNVGVAVGIIDGFVYLGTGTMSLTYYFVLPKDELDAAGNLIGPATDPANWIAWPVAMIPFAAIGLLLCLRIWNAKPKSERAAKAADAEAA